MQVASYSYILIPLFFQNGLKLTLTTMFIAITAGVLTRDKVVEFFKLVEPTSDSESIKVKVDKIFSDCDTSNKGNV